MERSLLDLVVSSHDEVHRSSRLGGVLTFWNRPSRLYAVLSLGGQIRPFRLYEKLTFGTGCLVP